MKRLALLALLALPQVYAEPATKPTTKPAATQKAADDFFGDIVADKIVLEKPPAKPEGTYAEPNGLLHQQLDYGIHRLDSHAEVNALLKKAGFKKKNATKTNESWERTLKNGDEELLHVTYFDDEDALRWMELLTFFK